MQRLWLVRGGRHGEREQEALTSNVLVPGFDVVEGLSSAKSKAEVSARIRTALPDASEGRVKHFTNQLWQFVHTIAVGDIVVMPRKRTPFVAVGEVSGGYRYHEQTTTYRHVRPVKWLNTEVPRDTFKQDLRYSFGAFMTICEISRNSALERVRAVLKTGTDPGPVGTGRQSGRKEEEDGEEAESESAIQDIEELARDQIRQHVGSVFIGHEMARLVEGVLQAEGYVTEVSPPGRDGGVDILAGRGSLGFNSPRLCVQVKSGRGSSDVTVLRALQGTMQNVNADHGLLVSWGGVTQEVQREARQSYFAVRVWQSGDLIDAVLRNYDRLSEQIRSELPLKRTWTLVLEE